MISDKGTPHPIEITSRIRLALGQIASVSFRVDLAVEHKNALVGRFIGFSHGRKRRPFYERRFRCVIWPPLLAGPRTLGEAAELL
jgi:hypothetical protein